MIGNMTHEGILTTSKYWETMPLAHECIFLFPNVSHDHSNGLYYTEP